MALRYRHLLLFCLPVIISAQYKDGDIRLIGGSYPWEGRVEIYFSQTWGTITDFEWTSDDAQAVCRTLGYFEAGASGQTRAYFGTGSGPIHLDYVVCSGSEYNLRDCHTGNGTTPSSLSQNVGVKCQTINSSYRDGSIRLVGGDYNWEGRVEIFYSGTWSAISDTSWTSSDATVVCRELRHSTEGAVPHCCGYYGEGSGPINVHSVSCSGSEAKLSSCSYNTSTVYDHWMGVGVQCQQGEVYHEGDIRLVGGSYSWQGRVEIYLYGEWRTITDLSTIATDAQVVCRQLGYDTRCEQVNRNGYADVNHNNAPFGGGSGPVHWIHPLCKGTEYKLVECNYVNGTQHADDWSITCKNDFPSTGEVRIYLDKNRAFYYYGVVEVYVSEVWGAVANAGSWSLADGEVVCRQLGFEIPSNGIDLDTFYYSNRYRAAAIHMSNVQCSGNESRLIDCSHNSGGIGSVATLDCDYRTSEQRCDAGNIRLVGGETETEGRVEVCTSAYRWGTVCNKHWTSSITTVVCRNLGYNYIEGSESLHTFGGTWIPVLMDYVKCSGSEVRLWDCLHFTHSYSGCSHSDDAGVRCQPVQCDDGDVKILSGETTGQLEVCSYKRWATACVGGWSHADASVVCRQLGYSSGTIVRSRRYYYSRSLHISDVSCSGTETRLSDCNYTTNENTYCVYHHVIGVNCSIADCVDGQLRLMEGEFEWEGRLEVCFGQRWGTVSSDGWTETNNQIACNDLGFDPDTEVEEANNSPLRTVTNSMPVFMSTVRCSHGDITLLDCSHHRNSPNMNHFNDVGIKCKKYSCDDGDLRLFGGESESKGLLEVCFGQRWGTVNGDGWTSSNTQVACRQLGFGGAGSYTTNERKGIPSLPKFMNNVVCYGSENKLEDCTYRTNATEDEQIITIWIKCNIISATEQATQATFDTMETSTTTLSKESTSATSIVAVAAALIGLVVTILVIGFLIGYKMCRHKRKTHTSGSIRYQTDKGGTTRVTSNEKFEEPRNDKAKSGALYATDKMESPPLYQQLISSTMQKKGDYENIQKLGEMKQVVK